MGAEKEGKGSAEWGNKKSTHFCLYVSDKLDVEGIGRQREMFPPKQRGCSADLPALFLSTKRVFHREKAPNNEIGIGERTESEMPQFAAVLM